jgi:hypothetical protein
MDSKTLTAQKRQTSIAAALLAAGALLAGVITPSTLPTYRGEGLDGPGEYGFPGQLQVLGIEWALGAESPAVASERSRPNQPNHGERLWAESGRRVRTGSSTVFWLVANPWIAYQLQKSKNPAGPRSPPSSLIS